MLELQHIHKMYNPGTINEICLFEDFNLKIEDGQFVSVVGSNGSGKTSMLNIICGSIPVDAGKILVNGVDISRQKDYIRHRRIGRVFQDPSKGTCPSMTILENLATLRTTRERLMVSEEEPTMREWMRIVNFLQVLGWDWKTRCIQRSGHFPVDSGRHWHFLWRP